MPRETILIDADDTLWENNVYFEQTIEEFLTLLEPFGYPREYARHILNETERRNIRQHGYGVRSFGRSLEDTYMKLAGHQAVRSSSWTRRWIFSTVERSAWCPASFMYVSSSDRPKLRTP